MSAAGSYQAQVVALDADLDRLVRRLGRLSSNGWRPREPAVRALAQQLADLAAAAEGHPSRPIPALPLYGLADAIALLGGDAAAALRERENGDLLAQAAELVSAGLAATR